ncbi:MAG TPA: BatA and WFA domain-containing protein [Planctomycetota bacterium]|nr:BatA and WFA domain-containing protein [Planctomycetota bacterium]
MLNPLVLLALAGLSIPVIIHLIHKQKLQPRLLATLKFLDPGEAPNAYAPVPRDILQLILRLLLLTVFILLMVRFTVHSPAVGTRALAIVLDQSLSMQRKLPDGRTLFGHQKEQIGELIDTMNGGDQFALLLVGDDVTQETPFLRDKAKLKEALERFRVSDGAGRGLAPAIRNAIQQLQSRKELNTCVLVFSDHQRASYESLAGDGSLHTMLARGRVKLYLITEPLEDKPNIAIESASFSPQAVYLGSGGKLTATVRNYSKEDQSIEAYFAEGETVGENRALTLKPGEVARIDLAQTFESPVDVACRATISDDVLPADNVFYQPMRMRDRRQILVVAPPRPDEEGEMQASYRGVDLLSYAINPGEALGLGTGTAISVKRITSNILEKVSLPIYSAIIVYGLAELPPKSVTDLLAYVNNGGGLCFIPDSRVSPVQFNDNFGPVLAGFQLGGLKQAGEPVFLDKNEAAIGHPLLYPLIREEWGEVQDIHFSTYFGVQSKGLLASALRGANGDWLLALGKLGRGDVCVQMFSCDVADSSMPRSTAFVPMVQEIVGRLGVKSIEPEPDVIRVNELARVSVPEFRSLAGEVQVKGPEERAYPLDAAEQGTVSVAGVQRAGNYKLLHKDKPGMRPRWLAVNPAQGESDLTSISEKEQAEILGTENAGRIGFEKLEFAHRREVLGIMAIILFIAFAVEAVVGAVQSRKEAPGGESGDATPQAEGGGR